MAQLKPRYLQILAVRQRSGQPSIVKPVFGVSLATAFVIALAIFIKPERADLSYHFIEVKGLITVVSAFFLAAASTFMLSVFAIEASRRGPRNWIWLMLGIGLAFLSLDEGFKIHELIADGIKDHIGSKSPFGSWDDSIVVLYGVVVLPVFWISLPKLLPVRSMPELMALAFLFYASHTLADALVLHTSDTTHIVEESFKLFGSAFLAAAGYAGLKWSIWKNSANR